MAGKLQGKVAVVTGAGRGIGRGIAIRLASEGAKVIVADYGGPVEAVGGGSTAPADEVVAQIGESGGTAVACYENVGTMDGGRRTIETAVERFGRLDALVCCAGILVQKPIWEMTENDWDSVIQVHLKGHFSTTRAAVPIMRKQKSGRLVFFSSNAALSGSLDQPSYASAKGGIIAFTWSCSAAIKPYGITANCILPGGATRMTDKVWGDKGLLGDQVGQKLRSGLAQGTYRDPSNVGPAVAYLVSDQAAGITGQLFGVVGYQITRFLPFKADHTMRSDGPWSMDDLFQRFPREFGAELGHPSQQWPPP